MNTVKNPVRVADRIFAAAQRVALGETQGIKKIGPVDWYNQRKRAREEKATAEEEKTYIDQTTS